MKARTIVLYMFVLASMVLASCAGGATPSVVATQAEPTATTEAAKPTDTTAAAAPTNTTEAAKPTDTPAKPTDTPAKPTTTGGKIATLIFTQEFDSLNPLYSNMYFSLITLQLWNCWAWDYDENNKPVPLLVKEMPSVENGDISSDGKTITLKLRDGIVWSDGQPITSDDFVFTYKMTVDPKNTVATTYPYDKLSSVEAPDKSTVVMKFAEPFAPWLFFWHGLIPAHVLQSVYDQAGSLNDADWNKAPTVGCGPFVFDKWERGSYATFVANDKYWLGRPKLDQIFIKFVPDDAAQIAALKAGDGDMGVFISYPDIPTLESAGLKVVKVASGYNEGFYFFLGEKAHPALKDVRVRQAIAYAINREDITQKLLLGKTQPAATFWDNSPYVDPSIKPYPFDPTKAKQLLDEAGWKDNGSGVREKDGVKLHLKYGTTTKEVRQDTQAIVKQQLAEVGIDVELLNYESDNFFATFDKNGPAATGQLDIMEWSDVPTAFPDPDIAYWNCSEIPTADKPQGVNYQAICDKELDDLFTLQATQVDYNARVDTFHKISKMIFDKVYWLGLWQDPDQWALGKRFQGIKLSGATPFFDALNWDLSQ